MYDHRTVLLCFGFLLTCQAGVAAPQEKTSLYDKILKISKEVGGTVHRGKSNASIRQILIELKPKLAKATTPREKVAAISKYLYQERGFKVKADALTKTLKTILDAKNSDLIQFNHLLLPGLLESKYGFCVSLSSLYLVIAEHFKLPLYPVVAPEHVFVRYDDGKTRFNIETLEQGRIRKNSYYMKRYSIEQQHVSEGYYLVTLKQSDAILGSIYNNLSMHYLFKSREFDKALNMSLRAQKLQPKNIESWNNHGAILLRMGQFKKAESKFLEVLKRRPNYGTTQNNLGVVYLNTKQYRKAFTAFSNAYWCGSPTAFGNAFIAYHRLKQKPGFSGREIYYLKGYKLSYQVEPKNFRLRSRNGLLYLLQKKEKERIQPNINVNFQTYAKKISKQELLAKMRLKTTQSMKGSAYREGKYEGCDLFYTLDPQKRTEMKLCAIYKITGPVLSEFVLTGGAGTFGIYLKTFGSFVSSAKVEKMKPIQKSRSIKSTL